MLPEQKKKPRKHRVFKALMAEAVGFEPTCPCGQLHFECSSLQPLRYASMYKYSLLGTNHMISSRSRYDHFDTPPYSVFDVLSEKGENYTRELVIFRKRALRFLPVTTGFFSGQPSSKAMAFRVSPVMTTSIPLHVGSVKCARRIIQHGEGNCKC